ncbi:MAG: UDP binding domain-containing protein, partial [Rhodothermia bacterium]
AVWGLSFKPNTDDIREAPSLVIIDRLLSHSAEMTVFDPEAITRVRDVLGDRVAYAPDAYSALEGADALVICTEWNEFRRPDFARMSNLMSNQVILDGRNLYDPREVASFGFHYESIGRPSFEPPEGTMPDMKEDA